MQLSQSGERPPELVAPMWGSGLNGDVNSWGKPSESDVPTHRPSGLPPYLVSASALLLARLPLRRNNPILWRDYRIVGHFNLAEVVNASCSMFVKVDLTWWRKRCTVLLTHPALGRQCAADEVSRFSVARACAGVEQHCVSVAVHRQEACVR